MPLSFDCRSGAVLPLAAALESIQMDGVADFTDAYMQVPTGVGEFNQLN